LAWSASFDCQKARNAPEKMVCSDPELSKLDDQLAQTYRDALNTMAAQVKADKITSDTPSRLIKEQKNWITYVRNVCEDIACLRESYQSRVELLKRDPSPFTDIYPPNSVTINFDDGPETWGVGYPRDLSEDIDDFNKILVQIGKHGKIIGCKQLIYLSRGMGSPDNYTSAGTCTLVNNREHSLVQICNINMNPPASLIKTINPADATYKKLTDFGIKCVLNG